MKKIYKMEELAEKLLKQDVKPSYPRIRIFEYLVTQRTHPTVDEIYHKLSKEIPTLSKTTVYNTLGLFIKKGLVRLITIEDNETRYDTGMKEHGHFKCDVCGGIYDFPVNMDILDTDVLNGFLIKERNVYFQGVCPSCHKNKTNIKEDDHEKSKRN